MLRRVWIKEVHKIKAQAQSDKIVEALVKERIKQNISQNQLARDTGLSRGSISYIERFEQKPALYTILIIADYLKVDLAEIIKSI